MVFRYLLRNADIPCNIGAIHHQRQKWLEVARYNTRSYWNYYSDIVFTVLFVVEGVAETIFNSIATRLNVSQLQVLKTFYYQDYSNVWF